MNVLQIISLGGSIDEGAERPLVDNRASQGFISLGRSQVFFSSASKPFFSAGVCFSDIRVGIDNLVSPMAVGFCQRRPG